MFATLHIVSLLFEIRTFTGKALLRGSAIVFSGSVFTGEDAVSVSELGDSVSDTVSFMKQICRFIPGGVKDTTSVNITVTEETKIYIRKSIFSQQTRPDHSTSFHGYYFFNKLRIRRWR